MIITWFFIWIGCAVLTAMLASKNGRGGCAWFVLGLIFGIFALIAVAIIGPADRPAASLSAQLAELEQLRRQGVISDAEYHRKKASLLS